MCSIFVQLPHVLFFLVLVKVFVYFIVRCLNSLWPIMVSSNYARLNTFHDGQNE